MTRPHNYLMTKAAFAAVLLFLLCLFYTDTQLHAQDKNARNTSALSPKKPAPEVRQVRMCNVTKAGLITEGAGFVIGVAGVAFMAGNLSGKGHAANGDNAHIGAGLFFTGGILEFIGGGFLIGGGIHDRVHKSRLSLVTPKWNEMGIAYSLR
jgi:hypothetical protein